MEYEGEHSIFLSSRSLTYAMVPVFMSNKLTNVHRGAVSVAAMILD